MDVDQVDASSGSRPEAQATSVLGRAARVGLAVALGSGAAVHRLNMHAGGLVWPAPILVLLAFVAVRFVTERALSVASLSKVSAVAIGAVLLFVAYRYGFVYPYLAVVASSVVAAAALVKWRPTPVWMQRQTALAAIAVIPLLVASGTWYLDGDPVLLVTFLGLSLALVEGYARAPRAFERLEQPARFLTRSVMRPMRSLFRHLAVLLKWRGLTDRILAGAGSMRIASRSGSVSLAGAMPQSPRRLRIGFATAVLIGAIVIWNVRGASIHIGLLGVMAALYVMCTLWIRGAVDRFSSGARFMGHVLADGLLHVLAYGVFALCIMPISIVSRLVGYDPLCPGWQSERTAFTQIDLARFRRPDGTPLEPDGMAISDPPLEPKTRRRSRARLFVVLVPVIAALAFGLVRTRSAADLAPARGKDGSTFTAPFERAPAFQGAPWAKDLRLNLLDSWNNVEFNDAAGWKLKDGDSEYVDVKGGERRTLAPSGQLGTPFVVWFFGGSVAFGAGQRDEHTIPSELVRLAGTQGLALQVRNFGVPATVNWQSTVLMIEKLTWSEAPPDLIIFYDGANDRSLQSVLLAAGKGKSDEPASLFDGQFDDILRERADRNGAAPPTRTPAIPVRTPATPPQPRWVGLLPPVTGVGSKWRLGLPLLRASRSLRFGSRTLRRSLPGQLRTSRLRRASALTVQRFHGPLPRRTLRGSNCADPLKRSSI